jgi:hypothetical protein
VRTLSTFQRSSDIHGAILLGNQARIIHKTLKFQSEPV